MSAIQLILLNAVVIGGAAWLVYALTHGRSNKKVRHKNINKLNI